MHISKRLLDMILALTGIIFLMPLFPIIAVLIKMDSKGPVFYLTDRVGKDMVKFKMYKFRTMVDSPVQVGQSVCPQYDPRVTFFGRFLRRTKLNELPQLLNILKGQMTFVGPRPEAPDLADLYPENAKKVFSVKPGLVGPATILCRNEEECYPPGVDAKRYYIENILPEKLISDLEYINNPTLYKDIRYIFLGIKETLLGSIKKKHLYDNKSQICLFLADLQLTSMSYILITSLFYGSFYYKSNTPGFILFFIILICVRIVFFVYFGMYSSLIRYISYNEIKNVILACSISSIFLFTVAQIVGFSKYSILVALLDGFILTVLLSSMRLFLRYYWEKKRRVVESPIRRRILIYGADDFGYKAYNALTANGSGTHTVVGFIDDSLNKYGKTVNGLKVLGNRYHIQSLAKLYHIEEIYISGDNSNSEALLEIARICHVSNIKCRMMLYTNGNSNQRRAHLSVRNLELSDILPFNSINFKINDAKETVARKTILLNGTGGNVGIELSRKMLLLGCKKLIIVDKYEAYLNEAVCALFKHFQKEKIIPILIENDDFQKLGKIFKKHCPDIVIQAAMRKYDSFLNTSNRFINKINYNNSMHLAAMTVKYHSQIFVLISTRCDEINELSKVNVSVQKVENSLREYFFNKNPYLVISRLCDIAENRGGIVSLLEDQIVNQGRIILNSENVKCCLITKHSASDFILQNISDYRKNNSTNNIYNCELGFNIPQIELAKRIAIYHGLNPWTDLEIFFLDQPNRANTLEVKAI